MPSRALGTSGCVVGSLKERRQAWEVTCVWQGQQGKLLHAACGGGGGNHVQVARQIRSGKQPSMAHESEMEQDGGERAVPGSWQRTAPAR